MVATGNMVALCPFVLALALLNAGQLFQFSVKALDIPPHIVPAANNGQGQIKRRIVRDHPINVTVFGDELEELHEKGYFLEFHRDAILETLRRPFNRIEMNITLFLAQADQAIRFQGRIENTTLSMDVLQIRNAGIP